MTVVSISSTDATDEGVMLEAEPRNVTNDTLADGGLDQGEQSHNIVVDPPRRRSSRDRQPSTKYPSSEYVLLTNEFLADEGELETFEELQFHKEKQCWTQAMEE